MLEEWKDLPKINLPQDSFGKTERFRRLNLDLRCQNTFRRIGWILFGKDGSLYFHLKGKSPILEVGDAIEKNGKLIKTNSKDLLSVPDEQKIGTHLSLHPSGEIHIKNHGQKPLIKSNIGPWLPVQKSFVFAHIFTEPVGNLVEVDSSDTKWMINDDNKSLQLDFIVSPRIQKNGVFYDPFYKTTIWHGLSPLYAVLINATILPPCESYIFFPASPINSSASNKQ